MGYEIQIIFNRILLNAKILKLIRIVPLIVIEIL